jgi:hypothetical protein
MGCPVHEEIVLTEDKNRQLVELCKVRHEQSLQVNYLLSIQREVISEQLLDLLA